MQERRLICQVCGREFDNIHSLAAHLSHHSPKRKKPREERIIELLEQLLAEIKGLREDLKRLKVSVVEVKEERVMRKAEVSSSSRRKLPSFIQDNPWIEILSNLSK